MYVYRTLFSKYSANELDYNIGELKIKYNLIFYNKVNYTIFVDVEHVLSGSISFTIVKHDLFNA